MVLYSLQISPYYPFMISQRSSRGGQQCKFSCLFNSLLHRVQHSCVVPYVNRDYHIIWDIYGTYSSTPDGIAFLSSVTYIWAVCQFCENLTKGRGHRPGVSRHFVSRCTFWKWIAVRCSFPKFKNMKFDVCLKCKRVFHSDSALQCDFAIDFQT